MAKDGLLEEYRKYLANPEGIPSDAYAQSLVNRLIMRYGSIDKIPKLKETKKSVVSDNDLEKMVGFVKMADQLRLDPNKLFESFDGRQDKIRLIRNYQGQFDATGYPSPRLERLFQRYYTSFKKKIEQQKSKSR